MLHLFMQILVHCIGKYSINLVRYKMTFQGCNFVAVLNWFYNVDIFNVIRIAYSRCVFLSIARFYSTVCTSLSLQLTLLYASTSPVHIVKPNNIQVGEQALEWLMSYPLNSTHQTVIELKLSSCSSLCWCWWWEFLCFSFRFSAPTTFLNMPILPSWIVRTSLWKKFTSFPLLFQSSSV